MSKSTSRLSVRYMSSHEEYKKKYDFDLPPLMNFTLKPMPNIFYSLKNQMIIHFFIKPLIDKEFDTKLFMSGAKQVFIALFFRIVYH